MSTQLERDILAMALSTKNWMAGGEAKFAGMQKQLDAMDANHQRPGSYASGSGQPDGVRGLCDGLTEGLELLKKSGRLIFECPTLLETKSTLLSTGLMAPMGLPIAPGPRPENRLRSVFRSYPVGTGSIFVPRETGNYLPASPVSEGDPKSEATVTLSAATLPVETLAHYVNVSKQALEDVEGLQAFLNQTLLWGLENQVENQIINGDGSTPNLTGLTTGAASFDTSLLSAGAGYDIPDLLAASAAQLRIAGYNCDTFILSALDWFLIETLKDTEARYLIGNPRGSLPMVLWNRNIIVSPSMADGYFLALDSSRFHIRQRMAATCEVSFEHASNWTTNAATIRVEERLAFVKSQASAAVFGQIVTSPA